MKFREKIICDNVHGPIGISKLEQEIINTRTFQRLKKIRHLGLASLVFPGAEHSRFSHSNGVMHVMSRLIDSLRDAGCGYLEDGGDNKKQKLRLAALLHDIGHYPLSHLGEKAFEWVDYTLSITDVVANGSLVNPERYLLLEAGRDHESENASHEALGKLILTADGSEIKTILESAGFDPFEIARIFNTEDVENDFYIQLISSTLDCDRLDYMLRDSISTGTPYGQIDLEYILQNVLWNPKEEIVSFHPKAITAIEHFITSRYFFYNIIYHKTIMGFEAMAKVLLYAMVMAKDFSEGEYGGIVHSVDEIKAKIKTDENFLANFNDEYFWYYLEMFD
ncbi:MAG: HD domain-containing protein, partial [bacterium]